MLDSPLVIAASLAGILLLCTASLVWYRSNLKMSWQAALLAFAGIAVLGVAGSEFIYQTTFRVLWEHERVDLADETKLRGQEFLNHIEKLREDVLFLAGLPEMRALFQSSSPGALRDDSGDSTRQLIAVDEEIRHRLGNLFLALCNGELNGGEQRPYLHVRLISQADGGRELVRVSQLEAPQAEPVLPLKDEGESGHAILRQTLGFRIDSMPKVESAEDSRHVDRSYLTIPQENLQPQEIYVSDVELAQTSNGTGRLHPVLRAATGIYDERDGKQECLGILSIDLDLAELQRQVMSSPRHHIFLTDDDGTFLIHPSRERQIGAHLLAGQSGAHTSNLPAGEAATDRIQDDEDFKDQGITDIYDSLKDPRNTAVRTETSLRGLRLPEGDEELELRDKLLLVKIGIENPAGQSSQLWERLKDKLREVYQTYPHVNVPSRLIHRGDHFTLSALPEHSDELDAAVADVVDSFDEVEVEHRVTGEEFAAHFFPLYYDSTNELNSGSPDDQHARRFFGLIMAFSKEEQEAELSDTASGIRFNVAAALLTVGCIGVLASLLLTQQNRELEETNEQLRLARDKAQQLGKAKDAFLASVSHELRNPLNQVSGFCQLLEMTDLDDGQRADLQKIRFASAQLLALINDILDYQKIIMGGLSLEPEKFSVDELVDEIKCATVVQPNENGNRLVFDCDAEAGTILADKRRVRQVLLNLVNNACKFTKNGTVALQAKGIGDGQESYVEFEVVDTGRGMTEEEMNRLFKPFTKLASKEGNRSGTGLGLVISRGLCRMMGGDISVQSDFNKGSTFTVTLPRDTTKHDPPSSSTLQVYQSKHHRRPTTSHTATPNAISQHEPAKQGTTDNTPNRRVLAVDDDRDHLELMRRYLSSRGFEVEVASGGIEGIQLAKRIAPAAITLDIVMPDLDGWSVLAALKSDESTSRIPVIVTTVLHSEEKARAQGAVECLTKPLDWQKLAASLNKLVVRDSERCILVIDDDGATREIMRRQLESDGWDVVEAEHGAAALDFLGMHRPAAIILDLIMPVMDGFEFLSKYSEHADWRNIPIIVLTAIDPSDVELTKLNGLVERILNKGKTEQRDLLEELDQCTPRVR